MWRAETEAIDSGRRYDLFDEAGPLSFREFVRLLGRNEDFAAWYTQLLTESDLDAFYWEHPPLTVESLDRGAEFVLIDAPALASPASDPSPFRSHFETSPREDVLVFPNLGGDATLIVPRPISNEDEYPHLAAFLRHAPQKQIREFWQRTAQAVYQNVTTAPRWLSTAGLGVAWLHVRIDTRPKYYSHAPYARYP